MEKYIEYRHFDSILSEYYPYNSRDNISFIKELVKNKCESFKSEKASDKVLSSVVYDFTPINDNLLILNIYHYVKKDIFADEQIDRNDITYNIMLYKNGEVSVIQRTVENDLDSLIVCFNEDGTIKTRIDGSDKTDYFYENGRIMREVLSSTTLGNVVKYYNYDETGKLLTIKEYIQNTEDPVEISMKMYFYDNQNRLVMVNNSGINTSEELTSYENSTGYIRKVVKFIDRVGFNHGINNRYTEIMDFRIDINTNKIVGCDYKKIDKDTDRTIDHKRIALTVEDGNIKHLRTFEFGKEIESDFRYRLDKEGRVEMIRFSIDNDREYCLCSYSYF